MHTSIGDIYYLILILQYSILSYLGKRATSLLYDGEKWLVRITFTFGSTLCKSLFLHHKSRIVLVLPSIDVVRKKRLWSKLHYSLKNTKVHLP